MARPGGGSACRPRSASCLHNHPDSTRERFPITRRLDGRAIRVARAFYPPEHDFEAAVADGVRELRLRSRPAPTRGPRRSTSARSRRRGRVGALELPAAQVLTCDPDTVQLICDVVARLAARSATGALRAAPRPVALELERVAVGVSHNDQKDLLRARLDALGLGAVRWRPANKLQGLEFDVLVCWHPLAGLPRRGRVPRRQRPPLRAHAPATGTPASSSAVAGDRELIEGLPPSTPAWPGVDEDAVLGGWDVHRRVFDALEPVRIELA